MRGVVKKAVSNVANWKKVRCLWLCSGAIAFLLIFWGMHRRKSLPRPNPDEFWESYSDAAYRAIGTERYVDAEQSARLALAESKRFVAFDDRRAESLNMVGIACSGQRKYHTAEAFYRQAIAEYRKSPSVDGGHISDVLANIGDVYRLQGRVGDAERIFKEVDKLDDARVAPNDIERVRHLEMEALLKMRQKRYAEARATMKRAYMIQHASLDRDKGAEGTDLKVIASTYAYEGNYIQAEEVYGKAIPLLIAGEGAGSPGVARALRGQANVLNHEGKLHKAEPVYLRAISIFRESLDPGSPDLGAAMDDYAILLKKLHRDREAAAFRAQAASIHAKRSMEP